MNVIYPLKQLFTKLYLISAFITTSLSAYAQEESKLTFYPSAQFTLNGKVFTTAEKFQRVDSTVYADLPAAVKNRLTHSAGLTISFKTNSKNIAAKWCVTSAKAANNLTPIANKGLDLYIKKDGKWIFAGVGRPNKTCSEYTLVQNMDGTEKECLLYLPLYDELKSLEIGIDNEAKIVALDNPFKKRILIYGSSIVHGASAARPGIAYPAILSRRMGLDFINLGISGAAKMEPAAAKMVSDVTADAYIMDCAPNPTPEQIKARTEDFAKTIRKAHPNKPIIFIQSIVREQGNFDLKVKETVSRQNDEFLAAFNRLKSAGMKDIYMIKADHLTGDDHETSTDGIHPNDLGFYRMANEIGSHLTKIFAQYNIK